MKREERILNALTDIKEEYIKEVSFEEVDDLEEDKFSEKTNTIKNQRYWTRWIGLAASIVLIVFAGLKLPGSLWGFTTVDLERPNLGTETETEDLDVIITDIEKNAGFSIVTSSNALIEMDRNKQLITQNPWSPEMENLSYPVYRNLAYSPAGAPVYFSEEELLEIAEDVASKLGMTLTEWKYFYLQEDGMDVAGKPYDITAKSDLAEIGILGNGEITIIFNESIQGPVDYLLTDDKDIDEAEAAVYYLMEKYNTLFGASNIKADCGVAYDLIGNREISFSAFEQTENGNAVAEYCFNQIHFYGDENGNLRLIRFGDSRIATDYMGDYAIITEEEARARLDEGNYFSILTEEDVIGGDFSDENIAKVELRYLTSSACQYFQPYYCFYVEIESGTANHVSYATYFVPALTDANLENFSEINPIGN